MGFNEFKVQNIHLTLDLYALVSVTFGGKTLAECSRYRESRISMMYNYSRHSYYEAGMRFHSNKPDRGQR